MSAVLENANRYEVDLVASDFNLDFYKKQLSVELAESQLVAHYLDIGWKERLDPSPTFSTSFYLDAHSDVRYAGINPLVHYVESGRSEGRAKHPGDRPPAVDIAFAYERRMIQGSFDVVYYLSQLPTLAIEVSDPVVHYLDQGWRELRDPSPTFSTSYYLDAYPDVRERGINPLLHYVESGKAEGRLAKPEDGSSADVLAKSNEAVDSESANAFGASAETESGGAEKLTGAASAVPADILEAISDPLIFDVDYYRSRYQIIGRDSDVVTDFLRHPMREASPYFDPEWYASKYLEVVSQGFSPLLHYLTIGRSRGLRPSRIFDGTAIDMSADETLRIIGESGLFDTEWYAHANADVVKAGANPLRHYSRVGSGEYKRAPNAIFDNTFYASSSKEIRQYKWHPLVHFILLGAVRGLSPHPLVDVGWLNSRVDRNASVATTLASIIAANASTDIGPNEYFDLKYYVTKNPGAQSHPGGAIAHFMEIGWKKGFDPSDRFSTLSYAQANPDVRQRGANPFLHFLLNGRAEGRNPKPLLCSIPTTLERFSEPEYGATGQVVRFDSEPILPARFSLSIAVHLHLFYVEMADEFAGYLANIPKPFHLFVSVPPGRGDVESISRVFLSKLENCLGVTIATPENRGRDVAPFLVEFGKQLLGYDVVLHLHSKKSPHSPKHADWRRYLLHYTLGNRAVVAQILTAFQIDHTLGVFQPPYHPQVRAQPKWGGNRDLVMELLPRFGLSYHGESCPHFPAGSFFWARTESIRPLLDGRLRLDDFAVEASQVDSTVAHALERLFGLVPVLRGFSVTSRFIDVAHNLVNYYGKSRQFPEFEYDRSADIVAYQDAVRKRGGGRGRIAVVTAIMGRFDALLIPLQLESEIDYFCVSDSITDGYGVFRVMEPPFVDVDPRRTARHVKTNLLGMFPGYDYVVWVDANVLLKDKVTKYVSITEKANAAIGAIPHPTRDSYTEEADVAVAMKLDDEQVIRAQMDIYRSNADSIMGGLIETNFMVFDSRKIESREFTRIWWNQINGFSRRDQLSINFALSQANAKWIPLLSEFSSVRDSPGFALFRHGLNEWGPKPHIYSTWYTTGMFDGHLTPLVDLHRWERTAGTLDLDVVVCVYNALEDVKLCLESVSKSLRGRGTVIIVDDASGSETASFLKEYSAETGAALVVQAERSGYTKAANAGILAGSAKNVLLLNSDTIVPARALEKLSEALDADPNLGIVGPLSNAASYQSVPSITGSGSQTAINGLPPGMNVDDMDEFLEDRWDGAIPRTPLVHGFCFCVKRSVFTKVGVFDEVNFPKGYGEENDFCFRVADAGYELGVLTSTYVFHAKSKSYGNAERTLLMDEGMAALVSKSSKHRIARAVATMSSQPRLKRAQALVAPLMTDKLKSALISTRTLVLVPSLRSDGIPAGSGYVRLLFPYKKQNLGRDWRVVESRDGSMPSLAAKDAVIVQRDAAAVNKNDLVAWIRRVKDSGARLVYEIDDDLLDAEAIKTRGYKGDVDELAERVILLASAAHLVSVSSTSLLAKFSAINRNTVFVPNALDPQIWGLDKSRIPEYLDSRQIKNRNRIIVGYVGTPTHDQDLALLEDVFASLNRKMPGRVDFQVVGGFAKKSRSFGSSIALPSANDYPSFVRWLRRNVRWDIGVIPLASNSFNSNKSYLKFLECGALGMALVCSDGPEYSKVVRNGETGFLVQNSKADWQSALTALIENSTERIRVARSCFDAVKSTHSLASHSDLLRTVVSE